MSYQATICEADQPKAMPLWESRDYATADEAYRAAENHIHATQPDDRVTQDRPGSYGIWAADGCGGWTRAATLVVVSSDGPPADVLPGESDQPKRHPRAMGLGDRR